MNLILERLKVFLMVMGSAVIIGILFLMVNARITSLEVRIENHATADIIFHDSVVLPMILKINDRAAEQLEISKHVFRIQCLELDADTTDVKFLDLCKELGL